MRLYRSHFKTFMGIVAFVLIPMSFLQEFMLDSTEPAFDPLTGRMTNPGATVVLAFTGLLFLFVTPLLTAAIARATADAYLGGRPAVGAVYHAALGRTGTVLWVSFLICLATLGGFLLLVVPGLIFFVRLVFGPSVVMVEGLRGGEALRRSWRLARGSSWKIFGTMLLTGIITGIVAGIVQLPLNAVASAAGGSGWIFRAIGASAASVITQPFTGIVVVLLYFDMRVRKEGFDLALMAQEMGDDEPDEP